MKKSSSAMTMVPSLTVDYEIVRNTTLARASTTSAPPVDDMTRSTKPSFLLMPSCTAKAPITAAAKTIGTQVKYSEGAEISPMSTAPMIARAQMGRMLASCQVTRQE